jgi:hypothetical protein
MYTYTVIHNIHEYLCKNGNPLPYPGITGVEFWKRGYLSGESGFRLFGQEGIP